MQKRMYKVLSPQPKKDGGTYWMRCGSAFTNRDDSINVILDALPKGEWKFQLRELDEEDLRRRDPNAPRAVLDAAPAAALPTSAIPFPAVAVKTDDVPF